MFGASGVITTNQSFQDNREQSPVRITTLDISKITKNSGAQRNKTGDPFNGSVYLYDPSAAGNGIGAKRGFRLKSGAFIPTNGLTVASANPVYIQGDFNTGTNPPSNSGDPTKPQAAGYTRQPCSVMADAVNILSNSWNDATTFVPPPVQPSILRSCPALSLAELVTITIVVARKTFRASSRIGITGP